jgi:hypothetical protein
VERCRPSRRSALSCRWRAKSISILEGLSFFQYSFISRHALLLLRAEELPPRIARQKFIARLTGTDLIHIKAGVLDPR